MKVLLTGGAGFIGSHVAQVLAAFAEGTDAAAFISLEGDRTSAGIRAELASVLSGDGPSEEAGLLGAEALEEARALAPTDPRTTIAVLLDAATVAGAGARSEQQAALMREALALLERTGAAEPVKRTQLPLLLKSVSRHCPPIHSTRAWRRDTRGSSIEKPTPSPRPRGRAPRTSWRSPWPEASAC